MNNVHRDDLLIDDGLADHLASMFLPTVSLPSTSDEMVNLSQPGGLTVVYAYPRTSPPDKAPIDGWDAIPGARGCTPQSCAFRDHFSDLRRLGVSHVFGLSTQDTDYQKEAASRLHLPFHLLSDAELRFALAARLPVFQAGGMRLLKRITLIINSGQVQKVFYPVHSPELNAQNVIDWLSENRSIR